MQVLQIIALVLLVLIGVYAFYLAFAFFRPHARGSRRVDKYGFKGVRTRVIILCVISYALAAFVLFVK